MYKRMWASGATPWRGNPRPPVAGAGPRPGAVHFSYVYVSHAFGFLRFWIPPHAHAAYPVPTSSPARPDLAAPFPMEDFLLTASLTSPPDRPQWHMSLQPDVAVLSHARELETKTNHVVSFVPSSPCGHLPRWSLACTHPQERQRAPPRDCPTPLGGLCGATRRWDQHIPSRAHSGAACRQLVSLPSLQRTPLLGEF